MAINHDNLAKLSWNKMRENLVLFTPIIILLGLFFLLGIFVFIELGILTVISSTVGIPVEQIFNNFTLGFLTIVFILIDVLLAVGFISYVFAMQLGMSREIVDSGKATKEEMFKSGKEKWFSYFKFLILLFIAIEIPNIILVLARGDSAGPISFLLATPLLIYFALIGLILVFAQPMITSHDIGVFGMLRRSISNMRSGFNHHFKTWLVLFLANIAMLLASFLIILLVYISGLWSIKIITAFVFLIVIIAYIILITWMNLYTFYCYHESGLRKGKHLKKK